MSGGGRPRGGAREKVREAACNAVAGGSVGVISATVLCPLDVIKTRLQVYGLPSSLSSGTAPPDGKNAELSVQDSRDESWFSALQEHLICFTADCKIRTLWIVQWSSCFSSWGCSRRYPVSREKVKLYFAKRVSAHYFFSQRILQLIISALNK
ncbi:uncharacterized protein LOC133902212 isoform X2 [Phragmites australis]|uniref:uncharacterized protein LOC133902212 isoform X2 n=1 Tax=Phragmites australis TaxID=29695 RepID=UPI002D79B892|nr:uncharacterized protein LOC133902212 isoform X2 [Phragmites australis]